MHAVAMMRQHNKAGNVWRVTLCAMHAVAMMRQHNKAGNVLESHSMCYARCCNDETTQQSRQCFGEVTEGMNCFAQRVLDLKKL